jgi:predicted dehydrogenase
VTKLNVAVIGAGHLGRIHARLLAAMSDVTLVGIADPLATARDSVASEAGTTAYADHRELISRVDAAVIAAPTRHHHAVALDFLRAGIAVLVEKPLAAELAEADDLVRAAERNAAILQVGHIERFNPAFVAAAPRLGPPRYIDAVRASGFTGRSTDIGVVHDLMIHDIDLILSLIHAPLVHVSALGLAILGRHEDVAQARLEFAGGAVANLSAARVSYQPVPKRQMQVWGEESFAAIDFGARTVSMVRPSAAVLDRTFDFDAQPPDEKATFKDRLFREILPVESLEVEDRNALVDELRDFVDAVRSHGTPRVTGQAGRDAVAVAERILSAMRSQPRAIPAEPASPWTPPLPPSLLRGPHWSAPHPAPRREAG